MAGANHREADADDRAEAGAGGGAHSHHEIATAFGRIADDLSLLAQYADEPESEGPSLEQPWDARAADELVRIYASGEAGLAQPLSGDAELQARLARTTAQAAALRARTPTSGIGAQEIEARLAAMARTIETCLAKLSMASATGADASTQADAGGLKIIEAHAAEILAHAEEARSDLSRLAAIEAQLGELTASLSEGRIAGLIEAVMPTQDELTRYAETAAQKAIRALPEAAGDQSAIARMNERAGEIQRLLSGFVDEHRQGEHQVAEALDTMQQALQYILDRMEAIEAAQASVLEPVSEHQEYRGSAGTRAQAPAVGSVEEARMRAGFATAMLPGRSGALQSEDDAQVGPADPTLGATALDDGGFGDHRLDANAPGDAGAETAGAGLGADKAICEEDIRPISALGPRAGGSARGHAGRRPVLRSGMLLAASLTAFLLAGYWLASGPRLRLPDDTGAQAAVQNEPAEGSPTLRSFSSGPGGEAVQHPGRRPVAGAPDQMIEHKSPAWGFDRGQQPETQARSTEGGTAGAPADLDRWTAPMGADTLQGPVGVVIEQGRTPMSPEELLRLRQRQRMANLSTRLSQQAADNAAQPVAVAAAQHDALRTGVMPEARASVELPPIMIGPHSLRHAAANGDASAQFEVAARFAEGKGVKRDFEQAAVWYQRAATQGFAAAQYRLAALYERGIGVKADKERAKAWYKRAAEQGNLKAMHNLAVLSAGGGEGATPDYATAAHWFGEAAARGLADSQYNLGVLHENGLGVAKDPAAAYKWYALAARGGDKEAVRRRGLVKERLADTALASAEADIASWQELPTGQIANDARAAGQAWRRRAAGSSD